MTVSQPKKSVAPRSGGWFLLIPQPGVMKYSPVFPAWIAHFRVEYLDTGMTRECGSEIFRLRTPVWAV